MTEFTQGDVNINGINIHYYRTGGKKPPFVLLHGASDNGLCWTPVAGLLSQQYDVIMPDAQGHGLSSRITKNFNSGDHARQIFGLIRELDLTKPLIMGHSMGAGTSVDIAIDYPEIPKAIILEDPAWLSEETLAAENTKEAIKQRKEFVKSLTGYGKRTREEIIVECRKNNPKWSDAEILPWADAKLQFDTALFSRMPFKHPLYTDLVPKINCPTLLIISDGGLVTAETARHAAELWKSDKPFRWVQIKGAGHNIRREQFEAFRETFFSFLQEYTNLE